MSTSNYIVYIHFCRMRHSTLSTRLLESIQVKKHGSDYFWCIGGWQPFRSSHSVFHNFFTNIFLSKRYLLCGTSFPESTEVVRSDVEPWARLDRTLCIEGTFMFRNLPIGRILKLGVCVVHVDLHYSTTVGYSVKTARTRHAG